MFCTQCGTRSDGRFCPSCGNAVEPNAVQLAQASTQTAESARPFNAPVQYDAAPRQVQSGKRCVHCGAGIDYRAEICPQCGVRQIAAPVYREGKSKVVAGLLALFLGGLGIHKFYLGETGQGVALLICSIVSAILWIVIIGIIGTLIIGIICLVQAIGYFVMSDEAFHAKYG